MKNAIQRAITEEDKVIGNLKRQFNRPTLHGQRRIGISPGIATGNIALAYHRGLNVGRDDERKAIIRLLKKNFPKAAKFIKAHYAS